MDDSILERVRQMLRFGKDDPEDRESGSWTQEHRPTLEPILLICVLVGGALVAASSVLWNVELVLLDPYTTTMAAVGIVVLGVAIVLGDSLRELRVFPPGAAHGTRYARLRYWTRLKTAGIMLSLLTAISVFVLSIAVGSRFGVVQPGVFPAEPVFRATTGLTAAMAIAVSGTLYLALRSPTEEDEERERVGIEGLLVQTALAGSIVLGVLGAVLTVQDLSLVVASATSRDSPFFGLAAVTLASAALYGSQSVPTIRILFVDEREYRHAQTYASRRRSVFIPVLAAFALLFLVLLLVFVFGLGIADLFEEIPQNTIVITIFSFVVLAMVATIAATLVLATSKEDTVRLYRRQLSPEVRREIAILGVSAVATALLAIAAVMTMQGAGPLGMEAHRWVDWVALAVLAATGPYGFYQAYRLRRIRNLEERFPDFLRDLASNHQAGLTLSSSIVIASKGDYGMLTPDVTKMADQISWNVSFDEALERFAERVRTPLVERSVNLIREANRTGGNVTDVLRAAARDARELKNLESERRTSMMLYTVVIYVTFFVFLAVIAILFGTFIPEITSAIESVGELQSGRAVPGVAFNPLSVADYRTFYFVAALVQAVGNGLIAGLVETGEETAGLRHVFIMVAITVITFVVLLG